MAAARLPVFDRRRAGVLLALSSLEAPLGRGGRAFIDWLKSAGFTLWQVLPLGPTGADGSPYWVRSDHAGNPALLDPLEMPGSDEPPSPVFLAESAGWLPDYALFEALDRAHGGAPFWQWPAPLRDREPQALLEARRRLSVDIARTEREQYAFHLQWQRLREYAAARDVRLFGDLPIYVAPSCAETWCHRGLFQLQANGEPAAVGGVPPDYFSPTGQMWGNPLYDWAALARQDFAWWVTRVGAQLARLDLLRLDHFRGLAAHWAVPAGARDASGGGWQPSPGAALLGRLQREFPDLPLVAEDLGVITEDVVGLMRQFVLPGMRVLQFGFDGNPTNPHLPYQYPRECVAYTGTHDNDTVTGWYGSLDEGTRARVGFFLGPGPMPEPAQRAVLGSVAQLAVLPVQDLLGLGSEARFNTPGTILGNWRWRLPGGALGAELARSCARLNGSFGRS